MTRPSSFAPRHDVDRGVSMAGPSDVDLDFTGRGALIFGQRTTATVE
jgi:hypothetical protein